MKDNIQVGVAATLGTASPAVNWLFENAEPILRNTLLLGQIAVAVFTALFIFTKWRNARKK